MPAIDCIGGKASPKLELEREKRMIEMEFLLLKSKGKQNGV